MLFDHLLLLRYRKYFSYIEDIVEFQPIIYCEFLEKLIQEWEKVDSKFAVYGETFIDSLRLALIDYQVTINENKSDYYEYIQEYETLLEIDNSYKDKENILYDAVKYKPKAIMIMGYRELICLMKRFREKLISNIKLKDSSEGSNVKVEK